MENGSRRRTIIDKIAVIVLVILGIGLNAFWEGLVRVFNIAKDRAEGFVEEERNRENEN